MLILVRHGATAFNDSGRVQGSVDPPLSERGRRQAAAVAEWLVQLQIPVRLLRSSTALRALETANTIAPRLSAEMAASDKLRERNFGPFEGLDRPAVLSRRGLDASAPPEVIEQWDDVEGVERDDAIRLRAHTDLFASGVLEASQEENAIVVTHAGVIEALLTVIVGMPLPARAWIKIPPASAVGLTLKDGKGRLIFLWPNPTA